MVAKTEIMKKATLLLFASLISQTLLGQMDQFSTYRSEKLDLSFHKNVELLGFGYFLAFEGVGIEDQTVVMNGEELPKKEWHRYGYYIYQQYQPYATSKNLVQALSVADHLWLDYLINLLLQVDEFPHATLTPSIDKSAYIHFSTQDDPQEAKEKATLFLEGLNDFYREVRFDTYLTNAKPYYNAAIEEIATQLLKATFLRDLEQFYGTTFERYSLIPSLTVPRGMAFGVKPHKNHVCNVFGAFNQQVLVENKLPEMGFDNPQKLRELSIHEFGHSFVNPIIDTIPEERIAATSVLFDSIQNVMVEQGYNTWKVSLYEHFVRAGEIMIASESGLEEEANRLREDYIENKRFIYLPTILSVLEAYRKERTYSYEEAVQRAFAAL